MATPKKTTKKTARKKTTTQKRASKKKTGLIQEGEICLPASRLREIINNHEDNEAPWRVFRIMTEFVSGFDFLKQYEKAVTFFGSARFDENHPDYKEAEELARQLCHEGFTIISGGGPGIMEASNRGASGECQGKSVGLNIQLPKEQRVNPYVKESIAFHYFFTRKVMLSFASQMYIFYPGGFGTLDEFFELVTLVQTKKIQSVPIILVGNHFWEPLLKWFEESLYKKHQTIEREDMSIYYLAKDSEEAWRIIRKLIKEGKVKLGEIH